MFDEIPKLAIINVIRINRNITLNDVLKNNQWLIDRFNREVRLGVTPTSNTEDEMLEFDMYVQELCDLPEKFKDVSDINEVIFPDKPSFLM